MSGHASRIPGIIPYDKVGISVSKNRWPEEKRKEFSEFLKEDWKNNPNRQKGIDSIDYAKRSEGIKKTWTQEKRDAAAERARNSWKDKDFRDRQMAIRTSSEWKESHSQILTEAYASEEVRKNLSKALSDPEVRDRRLATMLERYGRSDGPAKDTKPELLTQEWLVNKNVKFSKQTHLLGVSIDFFISSKNVCVFVDGCYWHGCDSCFPRLSNKQIDQKRRDCVYRTRLQEAGYSVVIVKECQLKEKTNPFEQLLNLL